jgi:hypothetical protein
VPRLEITSVLFVRQTREYEYDYEEDYENEYE